MTGSQTRHDYITKHGSFKASEGKGGYFHKALGQRANTRHEGSVGTRFLHTEETVHPPHFTEEEPEAQRGKAGVPRCRLQATCPRIPQAMVIGEQPPLAQVREGSPREASGMAAGLGPSPQSSPPPGLPEWPMWGLDSLVSLTTAPFCLCLPTWVWSLFLFQAARMAGWLPANSFHQPVPMGSTLHHPCFSTGSG